MSNNYMDELQRQTEASSQQQQQQHARPFGLPHQQHMISPQVPQPPLEVVAPSREGKTKKYLIIGAIVVVVALTVWFLYSKSKDSSSSPLRLAGGVGGGSTADWDARERRFIELIERQRQDIVKLQLDIETLSTETLKQSRYQQQINQRILGGSAGSINAGSPSPLQKSIDERVNPPPHLRPTQTLSPAP